MKILLYATFLLMAMTPAVYAQVEVVDLTSDLPKVEEEERQYSWFWQRKDKPKAKSEESSAKKPFEHEEEDSKGSAPVPFEISTPQIALLLPLTGQYAVAASAIREGFIGSYYIDSGYRIGMHAQVEVYDTNADKDVVKAYRNAIDDGANIIVGPLTKPGQEALLDAKVVDNNTVVITLNTLEGRTHLPRHLYPFALSPEDEAYRLAEQAIHDGKRRVGALVEDNSFGRRAVYAFNKRFEQLGGVVMDVVYFDPQRALEDPVHFLLKVEESKTADGETVFNRRRHDLDFIFLVANPQQGRQIPPLMQFYYAQEIPIYAMASVYSGTPNPSLDNDLNGIIFCDSPWIINPAGRNSQLNAVATQLLTHKAAQERLFAFGADAYTVAKNIHQFSASPQFSIRGVTGELSMDNSGFMVRNPSCARFSLGAPRAL